MIALSILTPSIPSRAHLLAELCAEVERQIGDLPVEHLILIDNKKRTVGEKRQALLNSAIGEYIAFVDDDDRIRPGYVQSILDGIKNRTDVITFDQMAYFDGVEGKVVFTHGHANDEWKPGQITDRAAWHVCAWRTQVARRSTFPSTNYGEDWAWAEPLNRMPISEHYIDKILHEYHYRTEVSEAHPEPTTE